jgi:hypothetical protein
MASSVKDAAVTYARLGISTIPVRPDKKPMTHTAKGKLTPQGGWKFAQAAVTDPDTVASWYNHAPGAGVGVVCGKVSGNLAVLDIDHFHLCEWMKEHLAKLLQSTWTVETGSGKLHIYVRSERPCYTTVFKSSSGTKLADLRADGTPPFEASYVVAPPSMYDFNGVRGKYKTFGGSPDSIETIEDASPWFGELLTRAFSKFSGIDTKAIQTLAQTDQIDNKIKSASDESNLRQLLRDAGVTGKYRRAILNGVDDPGEGDWRGCPSHSEVDYAIIAELRDRGVSGDTIEEIFATFPIGRYCYRNPKRPNHGHRYIVTTVGKVDAKIATKTQAAMTANGKNFEITRAVRVNYTPPVYELYVTLDSGDRGVMKVTAAELMSEHMFEVAAARDLNAVLLFKDEHVKKYKLFAAAVMGMATIEEPPEVATDNGYLASQIADVIKTRTVPIIPDDLSQALLGWRDDTNGLIYIRGNSLIQFVGQAVRPSPAPNKIWDVLRAFGGTDGTVKHNGSSIRMWRLPAGQIDKKGMGG